MGLSDTVDRNCTALLDMREQLVRQLGVHSVDLIIERAMTEVGTTFPAMGLIRFHEDGVDLTRAATALDGKTDAEVDAAFSGLKGVITLVLARLLGRESALRMTGADVTRTLHTKAPSAES